MQLVKILVCALRGEIRVGIIDISCTLEDASHTVGRRKLKPDRKR